MKPRFLSVVQFPFGNYHSPFSPTTFFEIGVYENNFIESSFASIKFMEVIMKVDLPYNFNC